MHLKDDIGDEDFEEIAGNDVPEPDIDDQLGEGLVEVEPVEEQLYSDIIADLVSLLDTEAYKDAGAATMTLLMEHGLGEYSRKVPCECPLCLVRDTVRAEMTSSRFGSRDTFQPT